MDSSLLNHIDHLRQPLLECASKHGTPLYVFEQNAVTKSLREFESAFQQANVPVHIYYAIKSNPYSGILETLSAAGVGLDASSTRELRAALAAGSAPIIFTGPAKTDKEFALILEHPDRVTVNLETEREMHLLQRMAKEKNVRIRCGIRVITSAHSAWGKFGQPLQQLSLFFQLAKECPNLTLCGIHFHLSWNETATPYVKALEEVGAYVQKELSEADRASIEYVDIGGGFIPDTLEGDYPWNPELRASSALVGTKLSSILNPKNKKRYIPTNTMPLGDIAMELSDAFQNFILPHLPNAKLCAEPGRYLSQNCMHILLSLVDKKSDTMVITDGGNNIIGWEKYQFFTYTPIFNLTHFSLTQEIPLLIYGSLCTPDDIWGYYLYCSDFQEVDILCLPYQGAYTYTLAQEFIREVPSIVNM